MTQGLELKVGADVQGAVNGINTLNKSLKTLPQGANGATQALTNFGRVVQDAPFGLIGIANNIDPLIQSFTSLKASTGSTGAAFKALGASLLGPAGIAIGISAVTSALIAFGPQIKEAIFGAKGFGKAAEEQREKIDKAADSIVKNYTSVLLLTTALKNGKTTLEERRDILSQLNNVSDKYFGGLNAEKLSIEALDKAYDGYINNLLRSFAVKQLEQDLDPLIKRLAVAQLTIKKLGTDIKTLGLDKIDTRNLTEDQRVALSKSGIFQYNSALGEQKEVREEINKLIENALFLTAEETKKVKAVKEVTQALVEQIKVYTDLSKVRKQAAELQERSLDPTQDAIQNKPNPINIQRADRTSALVLTPEALKKQGEYLLSQDKVLENLAKQKELINGISTASNSFIDSFFGALANNQDPFAALAQSAKRLVAELTAAVVKALVLKAITAAISGGTSEGLGGLSSLFSNSVIRGDQLRTLAFLRG